MNSSFILALLGPVGGPELIVIFLVILLLFGAKKIPELARGIGKGMGEFKKAKEDFEDEIRVGEEQGKSEWEKKVPSPPPAENAVEQAAEQGEESANEEESAKSED